MKLVPAENNQFHQKYYDATLRRLPRRRMRRMRRDAFSRRLRREHRLTTDDLIYPVFVIGQENGAEAVPSMPGVRRYTVDRLLAHAEQCMKNRHPALAVFPMVATELKTRDRAKHFNPKGLVPRRWPR